MKICVASEYGEGLWLAWKMAQEGHDVSAVVSEEQYAEALKGIVRVMPGYEVYGAAKYDLVVFDATGNGKQADAARKETPTIGDSTLADNLEEDRVFALEFMQKCGIQVSPWEQFNNPADAIRYIKKKGTPQVFKPVGEQADKSTTYVSKSAEDMLRYFDVLFRQTPQKEFVLQEVVQGTEVSTEVYINETGHYALNHTLELKKFMNGNIGPNTGCSGALVWMSQKENRIFEKGLKKTIRPLVDMGYVGPIDLNTIVNENGVWGLEFCARFGYDATALLTRLLPVRFSDFLYAIATNQTVPHLEPKHSFCASTRLSIPPYPNEALPTKFYKQGVPIEGLRECDLEKFFIYDVRRREESDDLESAGICGWIGGPLCVGETPGQAFDGVQEIISQVRIPNMMYRTDCLANTSKRYAELRDGGWLR